MIYSMLHCNKIKRILIINVGSNSNNFKIIDLAKKVKNIFKNTSIEIKKQIHDKRSYKVNFSKYNEFKKGKYKHQSIEKSILQLKKNIENLCKKNNKINFSKFVRLKVLEKKLKKKINTKLKMEIKLVKTKKKIFKELKLFKRNSFNDNRGSFVRIFCKINLEKQNRF